MDTLKRLILVYKGSPKKKNKWSDIIGFISACIGVNSVLTQFEILWSEIPVAKRSTQILIPTNCGFSSLLAESLIIK